MRLFTALITLSLLGLAACDMPSTARPDYTIHVIPDPHGATAVPPDCVSWRGNEPNSFDNQSLPQFGCATARNLALMVDRPEDLLSGRDLGPADGAMAVNSLQNYHNNMTRELLDPALNSTSKAVTTAPSQPATSSASTTAAPPSSP